VLKDTGERGVLAAQEKIDLRRYKDLQAWMLEALLMGSGRDMISVRGLIGNAALFPFSLRVSTRDLEKRRRLEVLRQGPDDDVVRVLRDGLPRGGPRTS
jgi:hypothetical protein